MERHKTALSIDPPPPAQRKAEKPGSHRIQRTSHSGSISGKGGRSVFDVPFGHQPWPLAIGHCHHSTHIQTGPVMPLHSASPCHLLFQLRSSKISLVAMNNFRLCLSLTSENEQSQERGASQPCWSRRSTFQPPGDAKRNISSQLWKSRALHQKEVLAQRPFSPSRLSQKAGFLSFSWPNT